MSEQQSNDREPTCDGPVGADATHPPVDGLRIDAEVSESAADGVTGGAGAFFLVDIA